MATYAGRYGPETMLFGGVALLPGRLVQVTVADSSTLATLYTDRTKTVEAANPVTIDALGDLTFFAVPGEYDMHLVTDGVPGEGVRATVELDLADAARIFQLTWYQPANLTVVTGTLKYRVRWDSTLSPVRAYITTAPTGSAVIFDVKKNGVSVFDTPPQIAAGAHYVEATPNSAGAALLEGDLLSADITQVGSSTPGASLTIEAFYS